MGKERVLIFDEHQSNIEILKSILSEFYFKVLSTNKKDCFFELIKENNIDLIFYDVKSGTQDELKTLKGSTIKKITNIYIPIIFPFIIMTLIQTLGMSFKVMIMGEYICQTDNSIGKILYGIKANLEMDSLIAYGILIVLIVSILELIIPLLYSYLILVF